jgi:hypothetical protein
VKQRLGAVLCLVLGSVLIWSGLSTSATGTVGNPVTICQPRSDLVGQVTPGQCPTGTITFTEVTNLSADPSVTPPASWTITVTSTCVDPNTGDPVDQTVMVDDGTSASTGALYVYADSSGTQCSYGYVETPVARFTTTYNPDPPQPIPFSQSLTANNLPVTVTNTVQALPTSSSASPTHTRTRTATPTHTRTASSSAAPTVVTTSFPAPSSSSAPVLATTGPRDSVGVSLWIGIALCLLGLVLLVAGRRPRLGRRHH